MNYWKKRAGILLFVVSILCFFLIGEIHVSAKQRTIRVGWPIQEGLSMKDEEGHYRGYTYDYLQEIAQYTGWWYEFVEVEGDIDTQLNTMLEMLEKGEIDLLGAMNSNDALRAIYDYPSQEYGHSYHVLAVLNENEEIDEYNYTRKSDLKIGAVKTATSAISKLAQFADVNQFSYTLVECENTQDLIERLQSGEVDAILSKDVAMTQGLSPIVKFGGSPFYFATTKGNSDINAELNQALLDIQETYPTLENELYTQYFGSKRSFRLTSTEKQYIEEHPLLRVVYLDDIAPLSYLSDGKNVGAAIDVMDEIARMSGLQIEYIQAHNFADYRQIANLGDFDVLLTYPYQYSSGKQLNLTLSKPYLEIPLTFVTRTGMGVYDLEDKKEAVIDGFAFHTHKGEELYKVSTVKEALQAVESGKADYFYGIGAMVSYYTNQFKFENLQLIYGVEESYGKLCLGVNGENSSTLMAILNKSLYAISDQDLESSLYSHSYQNGDMSIEDFFYRYRVVISMMIVGMLLLVVFAIYRYYAQQLKMKQQLELENQRYKMLSEISQEMIFEYDFHQDTLTVNQDQGKHRRIEHYMENTKRNHGERLMYTLVPLIEHPKQQCELALLMENHQLCWHRIITRTLYDKNNQPILLIGRMRDVNEEVIERERLKQAAQIDKLTGVYNGNSIREMVAKLLKDALPQKSVLIIVDMDHFKEINDHYGHYQGDRVLAQSGALLNEIFSPYGVVGRLGGDEFLIYLPDSGGDEMIISLCEDLFSRFALLPIAKSIECAIAASIGYAFVEERNESFYRIYQHADEALYQVKEHGRSAISKYKAP